jgi:hypothetical protein
VAKIILVTNQGNIETVVNRARKIHETLLIQGRIFELFRFNEKDRVGIYIEQEEGKERIL